MSARSRTTAGPRERGRPRAVPGVFCGIHALPVQQTRAALQIVCPVQEHAHQTCSLISSKKLDAEPCGHSRTRTRSSGLSHGLCSVFPMISALFRARFFGRFQVCDIVSPHFWLHLSPATGFRQALHHDRTASVGLFSQDTRVCWSPLSTTHHESISAPRRRHGGATASSSHSAPL